MYTLKKDQSCAQNTCRIMPMYSDMCTQQYNHHIHTYIYTQTLVDHIAPPTHIYSYLTTLPNHTRAYELSRIMGSHWRRIKWGSSILHTFKGNVSLPS